MCNKNKLFFLFSQIKKNNEQSHRPREQHELNLSQPHTHLTTIKQRQTNTLHS